jgi:hypothetical protein
MKAQLKFIATFGNVLFIFWLLYNAIDSGLSGTGPEIISAVTLIFLLILNICLINSQSANKRP